MYRPAHFATDAAGAAALVDASPLAHLVVVTSDGRIEATPVPLIRRGTSLVGHLARPNPVWRHPGPALAIFGGVDAYVSPRWYAQKQLDGRVVPTWNYTTVHARGRLVAHDDAAWVLELVRELTDRMEAPADEPWSTGDAPPDYIAQLCRAIVGIELVDVELEGKAKLSQNRAGDVSSVVAGLLDGSAGDRATAEAMRTAASVADPDAGGGGRGGGR